MPPVGRTRDHDPYYVPEEAMQADLCASPRRGVDGEVTLIGSANMDRRSFDLNYENNILWARETAQARGTRPR